MRWCTRMAGLLGAALVASVASAQAGPDDTVVARVGTAEITRGELERRMSRVPGIQLATLGQGPAEIRRAFLERVLVRERLYELAAAERKVSEQPEMRLRLQDALRSALVGKLRKEADPGAISDEEIKAYYEANRDRFQGAERILVWRILVETREEAQKILDEVKKPGSEARWKEIARERSTDHASNERGGDLGFLSPDGHSHEVSVKADPALYAAASKLANGAVGPEPVAEGKGWAVIWRRGSQPAMRRPLELEATSIRALLSRQKVEASIKAITDRLRQEVVRDVSYEGVNVVDVSAIGEVSPRKRSDVIRHKATGKPQPAGSSGVLR